MTFTSDGSGELIGFRMQIQEGMMLCQIVDFESCIMISLKCIATFCIDKEWME